jgi:hypothetical protein
MPFCPYSDTGTCPSTCPDDRHRACLDDDYEENTPPPPLDS